jgi:DNA-binding MarR family transcriptional regulator
MGERDASAERLHELFMELVRVVSAWHGDPAEPAHALSASQGLALHALDTDPPLSQQDLAGRLGLEKSSVSRLVAGLERRGLVERRRDQSNGRLYRLRLTDAGRRMHAELARRFHRHFEHWSGALTAAERRALIGGLSAFIRAARTGT